MKTDTAELNTTTERASSARERKPLRLVPKNESLSDHSKDIAARAEARLKEKNAVSLWSDIVKLFGGVR